MTNKKLSTTEKYYQDLVEKAIGDRPPEQISEFWDYIYETYGKDEWWCELLGYTADDVIQNMKDVFQSVIHADRDTEKIEIPKWVIADIKELFENWTEGADKSYSIIQIPSCDYENIMEELKRV